MGEYGAFAFLFAIIIGFLGGYFTGKVRTEKKLNGG